MFTAGDIEKGHWAEMVFTAKNILTSPNFLVLKICGKAQFPHSFGRLKVFVLQFN